MNAGEIRKKVEEVNAAIKEGGTPEAAVFLFQAALMEMVIEQTALLAEVSESIKRLAYPPLTVNADLNTADLSGLDFQPGRVTVMETRATLRDQFSMAAMQSQITSETIRESMFRHSSEHPQGTVWEEASRRAYEIADAMLEARKR